MRISHRKSSSSSTTTTRIGIAAPYATLDEVGDPHCMCHSDGLRRRCVFGALPRDQSASRSPAGVILGGTRDLLPIDRRFATTPRGRAQRRKSGISELLANARTGIGLGNTCGRFPHGLLECLKCSLNLLLQHICCIARLAALLHQAFRGSAYCLRPAPYFL